MSKADDNKQDKEIIELGTEYNRIAKIFEGDDENLSGIWMALGELHALYAFKSELSKQTFLESLAWHKENLAQWREDI